MAITHKRFSKDDVQILDDGQVIAHALRMTDNTWKLHDTEAMEISRERFTTSMEAVRAFAPELLPGAASTPRR